MTIILSQHPSGSWVEVYRGTDETDVQGITERFVQGFGLRCRIYRFGADITVPAFGSHDAATGDFP